MKPFVVTEPRIKVLSFIEHVRKGKKEKKKVKKRDKRKEKKKEKK